MISAENLFAPELLSREMQVKIREFRLLPAPEMLLFSDREAQEMFIYTCVVCLCNQKRCQIVHSQVPMDGTKITSVAFLLTRVLSTHLKSTQ